MLASCLAHILLALFLLGLLGGRRLAFKWHESS